MKFSELMESVRGSAGVVEMRAESDPKIAGVCEDSRKVKGGDLFVARAGTKRSGAEFAAEAVLRGAVAVVCEGNPGIAIPGLEGVAIAWVGDANVALAMLAHEVAGRPTAGMKMIAVTGTKGKTTVAYLLRSVLRAAGKKCGMVGTVEIDDGDKIVPADMTTPGVVELVELFKKMKGNGVTHCVMEVSSHALHQHRVVGIDFAVGVFTNLTGDHLDYHGTMEAYGEAKKILFDGLSEGATAVVNVDDAWGERMVAGTKAGVVEYGVGERKEDTPYTMLIEEMTSERMRLRLDGPVEEDVIFETPLVGRHNAYNVLAVIAAARALGVSMERCVEAIEVAKGAPGRLQRVEGETAFQVFVDYAHTHDSLENVLSAVRGTMGKGRLICVFGCGGDRDRTKRPKMAAVAERLADRVVVTSDNPRTEDPAAIINEVCAGFRDIGKVLVEPDRRAAIRAAIGEAKAGDVVVIAGKGHENYQIIGTTKHHFDDVEEAAAALNERFDLTAKARRREGN